jgi:hypothetical protein
VILQPSYIPWRGYFQQIDAADLFVFFDDVQYDRRGWRNRNRIKTANGTTWLTIPVLNKGSRRDATPINEIAINWDEPWPKKHWRAIELAYSKAPFFDDYAPRIAPLYERHDELLSEFTIASTVLLAELIGISGTEFVRSSTLGAEGAKSERLLDVLAKVGADHYISGPAARDYIEEELFAEHGVSLEYVDYEYEPYEQLHPPYDPQVSLIDLIFMQGPAAIEQIHPGAAQAGGGR